MTNDFIHTHDAFFKAMLENVEYRRAFIKQFLPKEISDIIDIRSLKKSNGTFINDELISSYADFLMEATLKGNKKAIICFLIEHKSQPSSYASIQILYYLASAYYKQVFKEKEKPQLIIPIIYYHGKKKWAFKTMDAIFAEIPGLLKAFIPSFNTLFIDLKQYDDDEIEAWQNGVLSLVTYIQKYAFDQDVLNQEIEKICQKIDSIEDRNLIKTIFVYLLGQADVKEEKIKEIVEDLNQNKLAMSTLQLIQEKGIQIGEQRGIKIGEQIGEQRGIQIGEKRGIQIGDQKLSLKEERIVLNAHSNGINIKLIAKIADISVQKVRAILKRNEKI
jgi:predicted transposase/invertase (TIGR01784 family)